MIRTVKLRDVAHLNPRLIDRLDKDTIVSFLGMADVDAVEGTTGAGVDKKFFEVSKGYTQFKSGDLLVAKITPCFENGKIAQAKMRNPQGAGSTEFHVVRPDSSELDSRYLLHFLRLPQVRIAGERRMTGSAGQRRVPESFLAELTFPLPSVAEQRRIAEVLDGVDVLREKRRRAIALLDDLARSIFLDMFGDPIANSRNWLRIPFGDLLDRIDSGTSPKCLDRPARDNEWAVLKLSSVTSCRFIPAENKAIPLGTIPAYDDEVRPGDLLFTRKNTPSLVAACSFVRDTPPRLLMPDLIFRFRFKSDAEVVPLYIHQLLVNPQKRRKVQELAGGSAASMSNISKARLMNLSIELPPLDLQREFAKRIDTLERSRHVYVTQLDDLDTLFVSLQSRAFRGEL